MTNKRIHFKKILPREKGTYGIVGEPLLLGLLASYSLPGLLVACTGILSVFLRQSIIVSTHERKSKRFIITSLFFSVSIFFFLSIAVIISPGKYFLLLPLVMAGPLFILQIYADIKRLSRNLWFEIIGVLSPGSFAAAIVLASGETMVFGFMLWFISSGRALPTFLYVRNRVRILHKKQIHNFPVVTVHYLVLVISFILVISDLLPQAVVFIMALYMVRSIVGLNYPGPAITIKKIGYSELAYGVIGMLVIGTSIGLS